MILAVVLDWAGPTVDFGSRAPVAAMQDALSLSGVAVSASDVRIGMGLPKRDHLKMILDLPEVAAQWTVVHGQIPGEADIQRVYEEFLPRQMEALETYSDVIAGVPDFVERLRLRGIRIGSTTGYTREMLDIVARKAALQGYEPDASITPEEAGGGRPAPYMCWDAMKRLCCYPAWQCVKIGDTPSDVEEGRNAGMWTIGITGTGNEVGIGVEEYSEATAHIRDEWLKKAEQRLRPRAHFLAENVAACDSILEEITSRLRAEQFPY